MIALGGDGVIGTEIRAAAKLKPTIAWMLDQALNALCGFLPDNCQRSFVVFALQTFAMNSGAPAELRSGKLLCRLKAESHKREARIVFGAPTSNGALVSHSHREQASGPRQQQATRGEMNEGVAMTRPAGHHRQRFDRGTRSVVARPCSAQGDYRSTRQSFDTNKVLRLNPSHTRPPALWQLVFRYSLDDPPMRAKSP